LKKKAKLSKLDKNRLNDFGKIAVKEITKTVGKGISPIEGGGRFPGYKNPENYPDKIQKKYPAKRRRPVNLYLSGDFLKNLKYKIVKSPKLGIEIGFYDTLSKKKEQGHREGVKGQPKRPIIPERKEEFTRRIRITLLKTFKAIFEKHLAKQK